MKRRNNALLLSTALAFMSHGNSNANKKKKKTNKTKRLLLKEDGFDHHLEANLVRWPANEELAELGGAGEKKSPHSPRSTLI